MAQRHNNVARDTDGEFALRAEECAVGIALHYTDLSLTEDQRDAVIAFAPAFRQALYVQSEEQADLVQIHTRLDNLEIELRAKYVACQRHIYGEMIFLSDDVDEHLRLIYDLDGELPKARAELLKVVNKMIKGYAQMLVELPGVELVASLFTELETLYTNFMADYDNVSAEHKESRLAFYNKRVLREQGEKLLRQVFHRAVALWGDDDNRLLELGFVPKSLIWTPSEPSEPLIPWPGPAEIEGEDLGDGMVELRVTLIEDMVDGFWEGREAPNGPWEVLIQHILFDEGLPVAHRELNVPPGKYEYRFTPVNAELAHGLPSMVIVMVK